MSGRKELPGRKILLGKEIHGRGGGNNELPHTAIFGTIGINEGEKKMIDKIQARK